MEREVPFKPTTDDRLSRLVFPRSRDDEMNVRVLRRV